MCCSRDTANEKKIHEYPGRESGGASLKARGFGGEAIFSRRRVSAGHAMRLRATMD